jgi:galactokinase
VNPRFTNPSDDVTFVIANSKINADKHDTAPQNYNLRVVETTCAAEILARKLSLGDLNKRDGFGGTLREVVDKYFQTERGDEDTDDLERRLEVMQRVVGDVFGEGGEVSRGGLGLMMGLREGELVEKYMTRFPGSSLTRDSFPLFPLTYRRSPLTIFLFFYPV